MLPLLLLIRLLFVSWLFADICFACCRQLPLLFFPLRCDFRRLAPVSPLLSFRHDDVAIFSHAGAMLFASFEAIFDCAFLIIALYYCIFSFRRCLFS